MKITITILYFKAFNMISNLPHKKLISLRFEL